MKKILLSGSFLLAITINAQTKVQDQISAVKAEIENVKTENARLHTDLQKVKTDLRTSESKLSAMESKNDSLKSEVAKVSQTVEARISEFDKQNQGKFTEVSHSVSKNFLYSILGVLGALLLSGILYWLLRKKQRSDKEQLADKLNNTKATIEEKLVGEFGKQTELMESQLQILEKQKLDAPVQANIEPDHSLALKLASEINLIQRNISLMDPTTKGIKQLNRSVEKLKDNLAANGYEIPELLGKQFHEGMKVTITSSIPDENLEAGDEIISKIILPQVNYNDRMIQAAQIEVSVGY